MSTSATMPRRAASHGRDRQPGSAMGGVRPNRRRADAPARAGSGRHAAAADVAGTARGEATPRGERMQRMRSQSGARSSESRPTLAARARGWFGGLRAALTIPPRWRGRVRTGLQLGVVVGAVYGTLVAARGAWAYATTSPRFEVKHLVASPTEHVDDARLRELLGLEPGTNILSLDLDELSARITADPWVARAAVTRALPDTLHVEVVEHEPRAVVLAERLYLADARGVLFKRAEGRERGELPIVTGVDRRLLVDPSPQVREQARARVLRAIGVLDAWERKRRPKLAEIHVADYGDVTLFTAETGTQIRLGRGDHEQRLARYDALRAALREQADELAVVHLDSSARPGDVDRVVVRFFDEANARAAMSLTPPRDAAPEPKADPGVNPDASPAPEGASADASPNQDTRKNAGKPPRSRKKLIPRAH